MAVYLTAGLSGAHLSPAVTLAFWLFGNFDKRRVPAYMAAQVAGAFFGAALVYVLYQSLLVDFEQSHQMVGGTKESLELAGVFSTYPNPGISVGQAFLTEVVITAILLAGLMALSDDMNGLPRGALGPLLSGLLIAIIGASMGPLTGFALNPARDLGPKSWNGWQAGVILPLLAAAIFLIFLCPFLARYLAAVSALPGTNSSFVVICPASLKTFLWQKQNNNMTYC